MAQTHVPHMPTFQEWFSQKVKAGRATLMWSGIAMIVIGAVSIAFPFISTLSVTLFMAALLIVSGIATSIGAFSVVGTGPFFGFLILGLLNLAAGVFVLNNPFIGMVYLTALAGIIFILQGVHEMSFAISVRHSKGLVWQLVSSLVSVAAGIILITSLMEASLWFVGFIFGLNFLSTGIASLMVSRDLDHRRTLGSTN